MTPTKQQWDEVKVDLSTFYGKDVYLRCDGYLVLARVCQAKMKLVIQLYVNGAVDPKNIWYGNERDKGQMSDIARRFYCLTSRSPSAKTVATDLKIFGKKKCKELGWHEKTCVVFPQFATAGGFINHIKKHNESIEVLDYEAYKEARAKQEADHATE